jgi:hypothetical protein
MNWVHGRFSTAQSLLSILACTVSAQISYTNVITYTLIHPNTANPGVQVISANDFSSSSMGLWVADKKGLLYSLEMQLSSGTYTMLLRNTGKILNPTAAGDGKLFFIQTTFSIM